MYDCVHLSGLNKEDDHYIILQFTLRLVNITGIFFNVVGLQEVIAYSIVDRDLLGIMSKTITRASSWLSWLECLGQTCVVRNITSHLPCNVI